MNEQILTSHDTKQNLVVNKVTRDIYEELSSQDRIQQKQLWFITSADTVVVDCNPQTVGTSTTWRKWDAWNQKHPGLRFTANTAGSTIAMWAYDEAPSVSLEYSTDNGSNWSDFIVSSALVQGTTITLANVGDSALMRAKTANQMFASSIGNRNTFIMTGSISSSGSITYLLYKDGSEDAAIGDYGFCGLFMRCAALTTPPQLTGVTTLSKHCYDCMFYRCTSLTTAPELPLTTLAQGCYAEMFYRCTSLTTAPELPSTTLAQGCYAGMFYNCTSLTTPPELPSTTLATYCYDSMFYNCSNLKTIRIGYTGNFSSAYFNNWVGGVASSGTFYYNGSDTTRGTNAIPNNWSVQTF